MPPPLPRVHAVTDDRVLALPDLAVRVRAVARAGDVALHIRARETDARRLTKITAMFRRTGRSVFVNDRCDLARAVGVHVHLPAEGLPVDRARELLGPDALIGRSTHDVGEAQAALRDGADYVFLGPVWSTRSHPERTPLGIEVLREVADLPVIAIGGITPERAAECREAGAYGVAVISAIWDAEDTGAAARALLAAVAD